MNLFEDKKNDWLANEMKREGLIDKGVESNDIDLNNFIKVGKDKNIQYKEGYMITSILFIFIVFYILYLIFM